jgi:hypothetical protein
MSSHDLCLSLAAIAGFTEVKSTQLKIYEAIRRLQIMEKAAIEAGLLPSNQS